MHKIKWNETGKSIFLNNPRRMIIKLRLSKNCVQLLILTNDSLFSNCKLLLLLFIDAITNSVERDTIEELQNSLTTSLVEDDDLSDHWWQRQNANVCCRFNHNHTKSMYEDRTLLILNADYLLNRNLLNMGRNALLLRDFGWDRKIYSVKTGRLTRDSLYINKNE
jgi:hypothetical protein